MAETAVPWRGGVGGMNQNQNHFPAKARAAGRRAGPHLISHLAATLTINTNPLMTGAVATGAGMSSISN